MKSIWDAVNFPGSLGSQCIDILLNKMGTSLRGGAARVHSDRIQKGSKRKERGPGTRGRHESKLQLNKSDCLLTPLLLDSEAQNT